MRKPRPCVEKKLFDSKNSYHKVCRAVEVAFVKNSRLFRAICAVALLRNLQKQRIIQTNAKRNITVKDATAESLKDWMTNRMSLEGLASCWVMMLFLGWCFSYKKSSYSNRTHAVISKKSSLYCWILNNNGASEATVQLGSDKKLMKYNSSKSCIDWRIDSLSINTITSLQSEAGLAGRRFLRIVRFTLNGFIFSHFPPPSSLFFAHSFQLSQQTHADTIATQATLIKTLWFFFSTIPLRWAISSTFILW